MTTSRISDLGDPDSTKVGAWLFRHRTAIPIPFAAAMLIFPPAPTLSQTLVAAGVVLTMFGEWLRLWAVHHIGVISRTRSERLGPLIASGPFGLSRNPLYLGNIAIWVGFALTARLPWLAPIVLVLMALEYQAIVRWEEALLTMRHGEAYRAYTLRVPRWLPTFRRLANSTAAGSAHRLAGEPATGTAGRFSWRETLFSERGTLIAIAVGYLLLWLKFRAAAL
jgi:protein-S-isoprenylcysteine O-methyltransferase Ste14